MTLNVQFQMNLLDTFKVLNHNVKGVTVAASTDTDRKMKMEFLRDEDTLAGIQNI